MNNLSRDISSIIRGYMLPSLITCKNIFNDSILLLKNTHMLLYIETLNNNINPSFFKKPCIEINNTDINYNIDIFHEYLKCFNKNLI
jgi:hypothetical protein